MAYSVIAGIQTANSRHMMGALAELAGNHLGQKRDRMRRQHKARMAEFQRRTAPTVLGEPVRRSDVPVTFKAEPKRRRVVRESTSTAPEPVKAEAVHEPIKAAELDKEMRAAAKRIVQADGPDGWRLVGVMNRESGRVKVYVRKHGRSARYSTAA
jgi:hypothetical protein